MRRHRIIWVGVSLVAFLTFAATLALIAGRSRPIVCAWREAGDPLKQPGVAVFNPFRDKSPERAVEPVLRHLRHRDYEQAASILEIPDELRKKLLEDEKEFPLRSWRLVNRVDSKTSTTLAYWTKREGSTPTSSPLWVVVERREPAGRWKVVKFDAWY